MSPRAVRWISAFGVLACYLVIFSQVNPGLAPSLIVLVSLIVADVLNGWRRDGKDSQ